MKKISILLFSLLVLHLGQAQSKIEKRDTLNVLFIGNSYTYFNNLPHIVSIISDSTNTKLITKKSTIGGAWLREHWNGDRELISKQKIENGNFDIVVLQEYSMGAILSPDSLRKHVKLFTELIRSTGAKPYLFLVWARERVPQYQVELDSVYKQVAKENGITLVPVGKAWDLALKYRPTVPLFFADGTHPGDLGTFLSAATFVGVLTGEVPEEVHRVPTLHDKDGETIELMRLDWLDMIFALKVAQETIDTYWK